MVKIIATMSLNYIITDVNGEIPWIIKEDLTRLSKLTENEVILMGRKTFESLGSLAMLGRTTAVITRQQRPPKIKGVKYFKSPLEAIHFYSKKTVWVLGGESIFNDTISLAEELHITTVMEHIDEIGCKTFPSFNTENGNMVLCGKTDNDIGFIQSVYKRSY